MPLRLLPYGVEMLSSLALFGSSFLRLCYGKWPGAGNSGQLLFNTVGWESGNGKSLSMIAIAYTFIYRLAKLRMKLNVNVLYRDKSAWVLHPHLRYFSQVVAWLLAYDDWGVPLFYNDYKQSQPLYLCNALSLVLCILTCQLRDYILKFW
jgi:hypothetical protein